MELRWQLWPWVPGDLFQSRHHNQNYSNHSWLHPRVDCRRSEISKHVFSWDGYHRDGYQIRVRNDARSMLHCIALCTWRTCLGAAPISRQINGLDITNCVGDSFDGGSKHERYLQRRSSQDCECCLPTCSYMVLQSFSKSSAYGCWLFNHCCHHTLWSYTKGFNVFQKCL